MCLKNYTFLPYLNKIYKPINGSAIKRKLIVFKSYEKNSWYSDHLTIFFFLFLLIDWCSDGLLINQLIQCIKSLIKPNWTALKSSKKNQWRSDRTSNKKKIQFVVLKKITFLICLNKIYEPINRFVIKPKLISLKCYAKN